jgi:hypothetical protein
MQAAYLAGLLDGEGSILWSESNYKYHYSELVVTNTNKNVLDQIQAQYGGRVRLHIAAGAGKSPVPHKKNCWRWKTTGKNAVAILASVLPYLRIKQYLAEEVLVKSLESL